jgi:NAD(P)-dependent dehydrogenase (short-subunit alcohol dehydrogenase family)
VNVVITGASRGIGAACARAFAERGARVALVARSASALQAVADEVGKEAVVVAVDLTDEDAADTVSAAVDSSFDGRLDVLVNNAGMVLNRRSERLDGAQIDTVIGLNLRSVLLLCARLGHALRAARGNIVNVSSVTGIAGLPFSAAYAASKSGVDGMTRALAAEWGPFGVRVNAVAPGVIMTDMWEEGRARDGIIGHIERQIALRRWGTAEEVADVVTFLASDAARYVTGQTLVVDGGLASLLDLFPRQDVEGEGEGRP